MSDRAFTQSEFGAALHPAQTPQVQQDPNQQMQAQAVQAGVGPPKDDSEYQKRKGGWTNFFNDLKNDPETLATLMVIGNQFMQPGPTGQRFAGGMMAGMSYQMALKTAQQQIDEQRRKAGIEERKMQVDEGQLGVQRDTLAENKRQFGERNLLDWAKLRLDESELASLDAFRKKQGKHFDAQINRWLAETEADHGEIVMKLAFQDYLAQVKESFLNGETPDFEGAKRRAIEMGGALWGDKAPGQDYLKRQSSGAGAPPPSGEPPPAVSATWEDIHHTARKHNVSVDEVLKRLGITANQVK